LDCQRNQVGIQVRLSTAIAGPSTLIAEPRPQRSGHGSTQRAGSRLFRPVIAALVMTAALGCKEKIVPPKKPLEEVTLTVACPTQALEALLTAYSKPWLEKTGARLKTVQYDPQAGPPPTGADAWIVAPTDIGMYASAGQLSPLRRGALTLDDDYAWLQLLPLYRNKLLVWGTQAFALPVLGTAPLCYYRADLFQDLANQRDFKKKLGKALAAPSTWDEYLDIAAFFHQSQRSDTGAPLASLPPLPNSDELLDFEFESIAAPIARRAAHEGQVPPPNENDLFSFLFDVRSLEPRVATPGFIEALGLLEKLQAYRAPGAVAEPAMAFASGQATLCLAGTEWIAKFQDENLPLRGRFGVARLPGSRRVYDDGAGKVQNTSELNLVPYLGSSGWLGVVPRSAASPEAALGLLAEISGPRMSGEILFDPAWPGGVYRRDHFHLLEAGDPFGLGPERERAWVEALRETLTSRTVNPVIALRTPDHREYIHVLAEEVRRACLEQRDPKQALEAVAQRWREIASKTPENTRRAAYLNSLNVKAQ
jgi:multiple sugar transport system substrate-binding protein